jgi:hypothetical protein
MSKTSDVSDTRQEYVVSGFLQAHHILFCWSQSWLSALAPPVCNKANKMYIEHFCICLLTFSAIEVRGFY